MFRWLPISWPGIIPVSPFFCTDLFYFVVSRLCIYSTPFLSFWRCRSSPFVSIYWFTSPPQMDYSLLISRPFNCLTVETFLLPDRATINLAWEIAITNRVVNQELSARDNGRPFASFSFSGAVPLSTCYYHFRGSPENQIILNLV